MDFRVGRGRGGQQRGRPIANAEVMEIMQQVSARLAVMERRDVADGDVSEPENEAQMQKNRSTALTGRIEPLAAQASTVVTFSSRSGVETFSMKLPMNVAPLITSLA